MRELKRQKALQKQEEEVEEIMERNYERAMMAENCINKLRNEMKIRRIE